jgi:hypothetical protein
MFICYIGYNIKYEINRIYYTIRMKNSLIKQCLDILKTEDVRNEIKILFSPVTDLILYEIYPYIYVIIFLVFLIFAFILAILIILVTMLRHHHFAS